MTGAHKLRVAIVFGGQSAEHDISIRSARFIYKSLDPARFEPLLIGIDRHGQWLLQPEQVLLGNSQTLFAAAHGANADDIAARGANALTLLGTAAQDRSVDHHVDRQLSPDVVFPIVHGTKGEDGALQGLLEMAGIPYVGAGVLGSAIGMDKDVTKRLLIESGIPVARYMVFRQPEFARHAQQSCTKAACLGFPLFVKPASLGSSIGVSKVTCRARLADAMRLAFAYDTKILVEEAVVGRELECAVLGGDRPTASGVGEIVVTERDGFYSYDAKYVNEHGARLEIPAKLTRATVKRAQNLAVRTFAALDCEGMARVDFFLSAAGRLLVNEVNTLPGFTSISMYPKLWEMAGIGGRELVSTLIDFAIERHARRRALRLTHTGV